MRCNSRLRHRNGKLLWTVDGLARIVNTTPVVDGDMLYVATWSPGGDTDARIGMEPWETWRSSSGTRTPIRS